MNWRFLKSFLFLLSNLSYIHFTERKSFLKFQERETNNTSPHSLARKRRFTSLVSSDDTEKATIFHCARASQVWNKDTVRMRNARLQNHLNTLDTWKYLKHLIKWMQNNYLPIVKWSTITQTVTEQMPLPDPNVHGYEDTLEKESRQYRWTFAQSVLVDSAK